jgi:hypothetical protein
MTSRTFYKVTRVCTTYAVRRIEVAIDPAGRHSGSVRTVARHDQVVDAEQDAKARQRVISPEPEPLKDP